MYQKFEGAISHPIRVQVLLRTKNPDKEFLLYLSSKNPKEFSQMSFWYAVLHQPPTKASNV